jgi:hypothetical protein
VEQCKSEFDRTISDQDIVKLSAEGKWLKLVGWCGEIIDNANSLDQLTQTFQREADKSSVVSVFRRYGEKLGLPTVYWHLVPRRKGEAHFDVNDLHVIFPLDSRVMDKDKKWRLIFLQATSEQGEDEYFMVTGNGFTSLHNLPPEYEIPTLMERAVQRLAESPTIDISLSERDLTIAQDLRDIICERAFGFGIDSLPPLPETDEPTGPDQ